MNDRQRDSDPGRDDDRDELNQKRMTFGEHLDELRRRLIFSLAVILGLFVLGLCFQDFLFALFIGPYERVRHSLEAKGTKLPALGFIQVTEGFTAYMKVVFFFALLFGAPVLLHQMWQFIAAGLYRNERRWVMRVLPFSLTLFVLGLAFGYFVLLPMALRFLLTYSTLIQPQIRIDDYLSLMVALLLLMGAVFQLPLLMIVLDRVGIMRVATFTKYRRHAIVANCILAAIVTPPDVFSQLLVMGPLVLLYEIGIIMARWSNSRRGQPPAVVPPEGGSP
jgi:Tat protein translocase TatC